MEPKYLSEEVIVHPLLIIWQGEPGSLGLHPGRLTWNLQITHLERKMIFQTSMIMFHVNLQGCRYKPCRYATYQSSRVPRADEGGATPGKGSGLRRANFSMTWWWPLGPSSAHGKFEKFCFFKPFKKSGQINIIPKPELRGFWGSSLIKPPFRVTIPTYHNSVDFSGSCKGW